MSTLQANAQNIKTNGNNNLGYLDGAYLADKFANYASTNSLGNQIDIMEIANAPLREYILHAMSYKYRNQLYQFFNQGSLLEILGLFGAVQSTTMAHRIGHFVADRFSTAFKATAPIGASAGSPQLLTLETEYSTPAVLSALDIDSVIVYGETQIQGLVIGIDTGDSRLRVVGVDNTGVPVTAGSMGGTPTNHVVCVIPMQNIKLPAVANTDGLFVLTSNSNEGRCPTNSIISKFDDALEFGSTLIGSDIRNTGHSNSTGVADFSFKYEGSPIKVVADIGHFDLKLKQLYKVIGEVLFGQKATNTNALMIDSEIKANNGIFTQAIANGGFYHTYDTSGGLSYASDVELMFDFMSQSGVNEAMLLSSYDQYKAIQAVIPQNNWSANIQFSPEMYKPSNSYQFDYTMSGMNFNFTTSCIEQGGKKIWLKQLPHLSDLGTYGNAYKNTGILIPLQYYSVKDYITGQSRNAFAVNVYFQKDKHGNVRDDRNMLVNGGASVKRNTNCDIEDITYLTQLTTEVVGAKNIMVLQGANPAFSLT